jgi:tetratricopeptide (TPR) repeat protein
LRQCQQRIRLRWLLLGILAVPALLELFAFPVPTFAWLYFNGVLVLVLYECVVPVHEAGHALAACLLGLRVFRIRLGLGKTVLRFWLFRVAIELGACPGGGLTIVGHPGKRCYRCRHFLMVLAGPLVNGAILWIVLACHGPAQLLGTWQSQAPHRSSDLGLVGKRLLPTLAFVLANALMLASNLWPRRLVMHVVPCDSDGLSLCKIPFLSRAQVEAAHAAYFALQGERCLLRKEYAAAEQWLRRGLEVYPADVVNRLLLGSALFRRKEFALAQEQWRSLLSRERLDTSVRLLVLNGLALTDSLLASEMAQGGTEPPAHGATSAGPGPPSKADLLAEADAYSREAFEFAPWVPQFKGTRGCTLVELGRFLEGLSLLRSAMRECDTPDDKAWCACYLALAEAGRGNRAESEQYLHSARLLEPDCVALVRVTRALQSELTENR